MKLVKEHSAQQSVWRDGLKQQHCNQVVNVVNLKYQVLHVYNSNFLKTSSVLKI